jgi:hypothetical protein
MQIALMQVLILIAFDNLDILLAQFFARENVQHLSKGCCR